MGCYIAYCYMVITQRTKFIVLHGQQGRIQDLKLGVAHMDWEKKDCEFSSNVRLS